MKNKLKQILMGCIALLLLVGGFAYYKYNLGNQQKKTVEIKIVVDEDNVIFHDKVISKAKTLGDLLKEMNDSHIIVLEYSESTYGMYIQGLGKDKLYSEDSQNGKYWVYSSPNNKVCVKNGYCDAADILPIEEGDFFEFTLSTFSD